MDDYLIKATIANKRVLAIIAQTTNLVEESRQRHHTLPTATAALGRTLTLVGLLSAQLTEKQSLSIQIIGSGPLQEIYAQTDWQGNVRGYVKRPFIDLELNPLGKLDIEKAVGKGMIYVIKDLGLKEPFRGSAPLITGGIAKDLAYYFFLSEQKPSAVAAGVYINSKNQVEAAGGFIIQPTLDTDIEVVEDLEKNIRSLPMPSALILAKIPPEEILRLIAGNLDYAIFETMPLRYKCRCNRAKCLAAIAALGKDIIGEMIARNRTVKVQCDFCARRYNISLPVLKKLYSQTTNQ
uniref:33 kDa chaperonin n=1 Tax=candidate division WOR-3 bacterium TaxID=2052148 RepID=A0A7C6EDU1_UNCW3